MLFDIETHVSIGHGDRDCVIKELNRRCKNINHNDIKLFLSASEPCQQNRNMRKKRIVFKLMEFLREDVDVIDFQSQAD